MSVDKSIAYGKMGKKGIAVGKCGLYSYEQWKQPEQQKAAMVKNKNEATTFKKTNHHAAMATTDYFERKLDDKRRLTIPSELRAEFESGVVITRGFRNYLHMYSLTVWNEQVEPALQGSILDEQVADINVQYRTGKIEGLIDQKQGRIAVEQHLLDFAGIDRDVVAVRAGAYWRIMAA